MARSSKDSAVEKPIAGEGENEKKEVNGEGNSVVGERRQTVRRKTRDCLRSEPGLFNVKSKGEADIHRREHLLKRRR